MNNEVINTILVGYVILFLLSIIFLVVRVKAQTGVFPIVKNKGGVYGFTDRIVLLSYVLMIANVLAYVFFDLEIFERLDVMNMKITGIVLVSVALLGMFISQLQMGKNWRIGVDQKNKTDIVEGGFFKYIRHPIYLFANFIGLGILFVVPWMGSLFLFFILWIALSIQARVEEEFLLQKHGKKYQNFMNKRNRWFS